MSATTERSLGSARAASSGGRPVLPTVSVGGGWSSSWVLPLASYLGVFAVLAMPFASSLATALPDRPNVHDSQVITWVLAWVSHALGTDPLGVYQANAGYPATGTLLGTHHLFASQILFAPLYAASGNPLLAANLTALLTYPLAALAMERLLRALGAGAGTAWVVGLAFALGAMRVPFNVHVLQYPNLFLPWAALALVRLRDEPSPRRIAVLFLVLALGIFACFYEAVLLGVTAAIWGLWELLRARPGRVRFAAAALGAAAAAGAILLLVVHPYLTQPKPPNEFPLGGFTLPLGSPTQLVLGAGFILGLVPQPVGMTARSVPQIAALVLAALLGTLAWLRTSTLARRVVPVALALWLVGAILAWGYPWPLRPLVAASPLSFFRYPYRFVAIGDFGLLLLVAVGIELLRDLAGRRAAQVVVSLLGIWTLAERGVAFARPGMREIDAYAAAAPVYDEVGRILAAEGGGALLELPIQSSRETTWPHTLEPSAMVASTRHWWPMPGLHVSYHPPHRYFFRETVGALPQGWALDDLIDATHVRWLLLRPASAWSEPGDRERFVEGLRKAPAVGSTTALGEWLLVRLDRAPQHRSWFDAVVSGDAAGRTVLGTPLAPLREDDAVAVVEADGAIASSVGAKQTFDLPLRVRNAGGATWPAVPAPDYPLGLAGNLFTPLQHDRLALITLVWQPVGGGASRVVRYRVRRDLEPGEEITQLVQPRAPEATGTYDLEVRVEQKDGARFDRPGNVPLRHRVEVTPPQA